MSLDPTLCKIGIAGKGLGHFLRPDNSCLGDFGNENDYMGAISTVESTVEDDSGTRLSFLVTQCTRAIISGRETFAVAG